MHHFTPDFFIRNREKLQQLTDATTFVFTANTLMQKSSDVAYPFQQDTNFWYLTGLEQPDLLLVMDRNQSYVILPKHSEIRDIFDGPYDTMQIEKVSGIRDVVSHDEGWSRLSTRIMNVKKLGTMLPATQLLERYGIYPNPARSLLIDRLTQTNGSLEYEDVRQHLARMRMVKTTEEIAAIKEAVAITHRAFAAAREAIKPGVYEYNLEAIMTASFLDEHATHAYSPIIASGKNACTIHYEVNNSILQKGDMVLLDVGASKGHGLADITRTYPVSDFTKRQQAVYEAVLEVQNYAMSLLRPGVLIREYEQQVEAFLGKKLRELGLIGTRNSKDIRRYFPHATSHFLGHDLHDAADYDEPLAPNMVLTVEPGIYIPEESLGVRIEDDVVVTETGVDNISADLP